MKVEDVTGKQTILAGIVLAALFLWYFDWAIWACVFVTVLGFCLAKDWKTLKSRMNGLFGKAAIDDEVCAEEVIRDVNDDDSLLDGGKTLWQGSRRIHFIYDPQYRNTVREVTVHKVISMGRSNNETYFKGHCHLRNEPRTFRLDRIKSREVTDVSTGEVSHFRKMFGLPGR